MKYSSDVRNKVYMIGPSLKTQGGISTLLCAYKKYYAGSFNMVFISSYSGDLRIKDLTYFAIALLKTIFICIKENNPLFHIHVSTGGSFLRKSIICRICKIFRKMVIFHLHGADFDVFINDAPRKKKDRIIKILNEVDAVVVLSERWKEYFLKYISNEKLYVVYNLCTTLLDDYKPRINKIIKILFTGRMGQRKGTYDLLKALAQIKDFSVPFKLYLYGDGEIKNIRKTILEKGLGNLVEINEWIPHEKMLKKYVEYDFLVLPSYSEGLPMSILEAIGSGMPVISSDVGGISEVVKDGINGFIVTPGDIEGIAEKIKILIFNKSMRETMGKESLKIARERFSTESVRKLIEHLYKSIGAEVIL